MEHSSVSFYEDLLNKCDALIKAGRMHEVAPHFVKLNFAKVPRKWRQALAKICRRSGLVFEGLRLLQPIIRSTDAGQSVAKPGEICEYAVLLSRIGAIPEALTLLGQTDLRQAPEGFLYQGFCHVSAWDYEQATPYFESFREKTYDPYMKLIAGVNLIAAYIYCGQFQLADQLLTETLNHTRETQAVRLYGNCLELKSQLLIEQEDYSGGRLLLQEAMTLFEQSKAVDRFLIGKWMAVIQSREEKSAQALHEFRAEAIRRQAWEDHREADFLLLQHEFSEELLNRLLFGTPNEAYRRRIIGKVGGFPNESFLWGEVGGSFLKLGSENFDGMKKVHQALVSLSKDFYAPRSVGHLFSEIYPGEFFDVESSVTRVRQALRRTRRWLEANGSPWEIVFNKTGYRLALGSGKGGLLIPFQRPSLMPFSFELEKLSQTFASSSFSVQEACSCTQFSRSGFHRFARWAIESGLIDKAGQGRAARYYLKIPFAKVA